MKKLFALIVTVAFMALSVPAYAHFQMIYSPDSVPKTKKLNSCSSLPEAIERAMFIYSIESGELLKTCWIPAWLLLAASKVSLRITASMKMNIRSPRRKNLERETDELLSITSGKRLLRGIPCGY